MTPAARVAAFCEDYALSAPILLAPMAGACPPALSAAVASAGGMGACGALLMGPGEIGQWASEVRSTSNGAFQINLWIPDPAPHRDPAHEAELRALLAGWGPPVPPEAGDAGLLDFAAQCDAMLAAGPAVISSIMGVYPPEFVQRMKSAGIRWFATATTVAEALEAEAAGADVIVAQGMEAGGHRGAFQADEAARRLVGLFSLLPAVADAVQVPVVATGGIADARGVAAALLLGASAVQIGTGFLRTPEAAISPAWADGLSRARPEDTLATRAYSGRLGRALRTGFAETAETWPAPAPYPVQRGLTAPMRAAAAREGRLDAMQAWAGQSAGLAQAVPAGDLVERLWADARALLAI
ncbi:MAG: nitronate monooxygenase [Pseudooceanicola sp.]|nr:nitronate monooxygenase [Pseudooceanicola sp.]